MIWLKAFHLIPAKDLQAILKLHQSKPNLIKSISQLLFEYFRLDCCQPLWPWL